MLLLRVPKPVLHTSQSAFIGRVWVKGVSVNVCTYVQACVSGVCKCEWVSVYVGVGE